MVYHLVFVHQHEGSIAPGTWQNNACSTLTNGRREVTLEHFNQEKESEVSN